MAFFASSQQELFEHRLRRSSSTASSRFRSRRPSGSQKSLSRSHISSPSHPLPSAPAPDDIPSTQHSPSQTTLPTSGAKSGSPSASRTTPLHARVNTIQDLQSSSESSQPPTPSRTAQRPDDASRATDERHALLLPKTGLKEPNPNMLLSSACSSRPKLIFENGSVSDSGVAPRLHDSLGVSSAHKGRTSLLDVRHPSSSSPNLSLPGYLSDSGISERSASPLHATRLDVKRLLSKPAAPSVVSALSIASDTDPEPHTLPRPPLNSSEAWPSKARVQAQPRPRLISSTMSRSESSEPEQSLPSPPPSLQQRPKVLRKKSTSGQHRTVMSATPRNDTSNSSPLRSTHQAPAAGPSRSQRSNPLQSLIRSRAAVPTSAPTYGSGRLTPAGAIAQAYKEQDIRREALAATASADTILPIIPVTASLLDAFEHATLEQKPHANVKSALSDTRPGNSMDSFVLVDSAQALCHGNEHTSSVPRFGDHSASVSVGRSAKSLTRNISLPLRHGLVAVNGAEARSGQGRGGEDIQTGHPRGNINGSDLSQRKAKRKSKSLGLSLNTPLSSSGSEDVSVDRSDFPPPGESVPSSTHVLSPSKGKEKVQEKGDAGAGTRLWRLVKRISTGGLRERFQTAGAVPPPVPTIPNDMPNTALEVQAPSESTSRGKGSDTGHGGDGSNCGMSHSIDSSDISPQSDDHLSTAASLTPTPLQGNDAASHPPRPSLSSSPQSSEPTTSIHFFRSHSSRSSFSSVVATSPPPPPVPIPRHSPVRSSSVRNRLRKKNDPSPSEPEIPTFSISDVVNNFVARRPSLARHQRRHAPTRSLPRIEPPPIGEVSGALLRRAGSEARSTTRRHRRFDPILTPVSSEQNRDSQGSDTTLRPLASAGSGMAGQCTFRELGSARGQAWSSQEKEDKWDDLLERSARAGGTLHLGVGSTHLASDDIRFSSGTLELET